MRSWSNGSRKKKSSFVIRYSSYRDVAKQRSMSNGVNIQFPVDRVNRDVFCHPRFARVLLLSRKKRRGRERERNGRKKKKTGGGTVVLNNIREGREIASVLPRTFRSIIPDSRRRVSLIRLTESKHDRSTGLLKRKISLHIACEHRDKRERERCTYTH